MLCNAGDELLASMTVKVRKRKLVEVGPPVDKPPTGRSAYLTCAMDRGWYPSAVTGTLIGTLQL